MPDLALAILGALLEYQCGATQAQVSAASGYEYGTINRIAARLIRSGWVSRPAYAGLWHITERGKIALAIEIGRRTKARAAGRMFVYVRPKIREFENA